VLLKVSVLINSIWSPLVLGSVPPLFDLLKGTAFDMMLEKDLKNMWE
jgi:hypothetical protein